MNKKEIYNRTGYYPYYCRSRRMWRIGYNAKSKFPKCTYDWISFDLPFGSTDEVCQYIEQKNKEIENEEVGQCTN